LSEKGSVSDRLQKTVSYDVCFQHGDIFTFILFGSRVTVALGPKGNNFILGGKSTVFNAEDAYKVHHIACLKISKTYLYFL